MSEIIKLSELPRIGLLADFSQVGLDQLVEFTSNDFYDLTIIDMQIEHIKERAKQLDAHFVVYQMGSNAVSMSDTYLMKYAHPSKSQVGVLA